MNNLNIIKHYNSINFNSYLLLDSVLKNKDRHLIDLIVYSI